MISRKKAADTGLLLTHFICFSQLSTKQMERNCIIHAWSDSVAKYLIEMLPVKFLASSACVRSIVSGRRGLYDVGCTLIG